jgi:hypothetical protein
MPIRSFIQSGAFDAEAIGAMAEAFDAACEKLGDIDQLEVAREVIAGRIIATARLGERNPARLRKPRSANRTSRVFASMARSHGRAVERVCQPQQSSSPKEEDEGFLDMCMGQRLPIHQIH